MEKKKSSKIQRRAWFILCTIFTVGFAVLVARLFQLQIIEGPTLKARALDQRMHTTALQPMRGIIYDRNETIMAQSATVWNIFISPAELNEDYLARIAIDLGAILEIPPEQILEAATNKESYYAVVKRKVDNLVLQQVEDYVEKGYDGKSIRGIYDEEDTKRYYMFDNLASTVIGFTDGDNQGVTGVEAYYNDILAGTPGLNVSAQSPNKGSIPGASPRTYTAQDGYSIVLTIDEGIQGILEKHLDMAVVEHGVKNRAVGIIMNIKTGEVLAMSTKPDFNPNKPYEIFDEKARAQLELIESDRVAYEKLQGDLRLAQWQNKAVSQSYEPGSVYKIVTAAIALEENKSYLDDYFYCTGSIEVADRTINCHLPTGHGEQNFYDIMRNSCNPAFVTLGLRNEPDRTYKYMTDFGLGKTTGIDLPGESGGIIHTSESLFSKGQVPLASTSFGQSFTTTPIQLITAVSAAVNGGDLVQPYIVRQIMDAEGNVVETIQPQVKRQVVSKETSTKIKELVELVVSDGSGRHAAIPGYRIGGKTGTSEILTAKEGAPKEYILSFVGFAPMDDPVYACLIALDEPFVPNPWGSVIAAPVVGAILQEMLPYVGVEPVFTTEELAQRPVEVPDLVNQKPHEAQSVITALGLKTKIVGQGSVVLRQIPLKGTELIKGGKVTLYTEEEILNKNILLPDLKGLPVEQAKLILEELDLNIILQGKTNPTIPTVVGEQWPVAESVLTTADSIILTLVEDEKQRVENIMPDMTPVPERQPSTNEEVWDDVSDGSIVTTQDGKLREAKEEEPLVGGFSLNPPSTQSGLEDVLPPPVKEEVIPPPEPVQPTKNKYGEELDGDSFLP